MAKRKPPRRPQDDWSSLTFRGPFDLLQWVRFQARREGRPIELVMQDAVRAYQDKVEAAA